MSTKEYAERVARALESTGLAVPVAPTFGENRVSVLCRVNKDNEASWLELITKILIGADISTKTSTPWQCHICRHYFLKVVSGENKLVWGWNFSFQSREMARALETVIPLLRGHPLQAATADMQDIQEIPLVGATTDRNRVRNGRGVHTIGGSSGDFHAGRK